MAKFTNKGNIPLPLAIFLAHDTYKRYDNTISATSLIRPIKAIQGSKLVPANLRKVPDVMEQFHSRCGTAIHTAIEESIINYWDEGLKALGHHEAVGKYVINPSEGEVLGEGKIAVYTETRGFKRVSEDLQVTGEFDFAMQNQVWDWKNVSTFAYGDPSRDEKYQLQGSIYRWIFPEIIRDSSLIIGQIFRDFSEGRVGTTGYPETPIASREIPLLEIRETDEFVRSKLADIENTNKIEDIRNLPKCSEKDQGKEPSAFKVFAKEGSTRATRVFKSSFEAESYVRNNCKNPTAYWTEVEGRQINCKYCPANAICDQYNTGD